MGDLLEDLHTLLHQTCYVILISSLEQLQNLQAAKTVSVLEPTALENQKLTGMSAGAG